MNIAFSPCPNDTFVFHALVHGLVPDAPPMDVTYADVDVTNTAALDGRFDLVKVSYGALPWLLDTYDLLPCGGALGRGCGPLVVAREERDLTGATVAVPGDRTTAYLLLRLWSAGQPPARIEVVPFHQIMPGVAAGWYDAGLVIHEARFTYPDFGLRCLTDLGDWWEGVTGAPIPLGAIVARRSRGRARIAEISRVVRASVDYAFAHPEASRDYVMEQAQELDPEVAKAHIALYVNEFTRDLGPEGYAAVRRLLGDTLPEGTVLESS